MVWKRKKVVWKAKFQVWKSNKLSDKVAINGLKKKKKKDLQSLKSNKVVSKIVTLVWSENE